MIDPDLELLYSPSAWSKRLPRDIIIENHLETCKRCEYLPVDVATVKKNIQNLLSKWISIN